MISYEQFEENKKNREIIEQKLSNDIPLAIGEQYFMCENLDLESCYKTKECQDEYFYRVYLSRREGSITSNYISGVDRNRYMTMVRKWEAEIYKAPLRVITDLKEHASIRETKEEIRNLKKVIPNHDRPGKAKSLYDQKYFELLAWSKFRHISVKKIFENSIKADYYTFSLNGKPILFDPYSQAHILARHYAHGIKQYNSLKDHFYDTFAHTDLHLRIEELFNKIENSGFYKNDPIEEINFRYKGVLYKIYINEQAQSIKGQRSPQKFFV
jgi:hypothetical protein